MYNGGCRHGEPGNSDALLGRWRRSGRTASARRIRVDAARPLSWREPDRVLSVRRARRRDGAAHLHRMPGARRLPRVRAPASHRARRLGWCVRTRASAHPSPPSRSRDARTGGLRPTRRLTLLERAGGPLPAERVDHELRERVRAARLGSPRRRRRSRRPRRRVRRPRTCTRHRRARRPTLPRRAARSGAPDGRRSRPRLRHAGNTDQSSRPGCSNTETESTPSV